jgi:hypothetical protein
MKPIQHLGLLAAQYVSRRSEGWQQPEHRKPQTHILVVSRRHHNMRGAIITAHH